MAYLDSTSLRKLLLNVSDTEDSIHVKSENDHTSDAPPSVEEHTDERQIKLDTDRSFVLYPVGETLIHEIASNMHSLRLTLEDVTEKEHLQQQLHELIVAVFRKRRCFSYFQVS